MRAKSVLSHFVSVEMPHKSNQIKFISHKYIDILQWIPDNKAYSWEVNQGSWCLSSWLPLWFCGKCGQKHTFWSLLHWHVCTLKKNQWTDLSTFISEHFTTMKHTFHTHTHAYTQCVYLTLACGVLSVIMDKYGVKVTSTWYFLLLIEKHLIISNRAWHRKQNEPLIKCGWYVPMKA